MRKCYAKFRENKNIAKWRNRCVVLLTLVNHAQVAILNVANMSVSAIRKNRTLEYKTDKTEKL